jgi:hypothetical protein
MLDEETLRILGKVRWSCEDLCQHIELTPEERDASNELAEKIMMLADEHFLRTHRTNKGARSRYFVTAVARAMMGINLLAQMHDKEVPGDQGPPTASTG